MGKLRFSVYDHAITDRNGNIIRRRLIVLRDSDKNIVKWTNFHKYARSGKKSIVKSLYSRPDTRAYYVVCFLNYVFFDRYHLEKLVDVTAGMVRNFIRDYGLCRLKDDTEDTHRAQQTVETCISTLIDFLELMIRDNKDCALDIDELFVTEKVFSRKRRRYIEKRVPTFEVCCRPKNQKIFRDIPDGAFQIIMSEIIANHRNILMLAALSAFAGLRPSECCNVRRTDSPLGPGLLFEVTDGKITDITIDLTEEKKLRSDSVDVGGIKKERKQKVYHAFLKQFVELYTVYMEYIKDRPYEEEYGALTTTSFGKAYTYNSYLDHFRKAVKDSIPKMFESDDSQIVHYGQLLLENEISPHILRHWFSVRLTLYGEDASSLMYWRGDKSPESALTYLSHKSELERQHDLVADEMFGYMNWKADKIFGGNRQ